MWSTISCYVILLPVCCHLGLSDDRQRRETHSDGPIPLTNGQMERIVDAHNSVRRKESATDMALMEWHSGLADAASNFTKNCVWTTRPRNQLLGIVQDFDQLSESVELSPSYTEIEEVVKKWASESYFYNYETSQCNKVCWHYTQVVWATSHSVGCSISYCSNLRNPPWGKHGGYLISCVYGPGGNIPNMRPYTQGNTACSNCDSAFSHCIQGLCSKKQAPSTQGFSTVTTPPNPTTTKPPTRQETTTGVTIGSASRPFSLMGGTTGLIYMLIHLLYIVQGF